MFWLGFAAGVLFSFIVLVFILWYTSPLIFDWDA